MCYLKCETVLGSLLCLFFFYQYSAMLEGIICIHIVNFTLSKKVWNERSLFLGCSPSPETCFRHWWDEAFRSCLFIHVLIPVILLFGIGGLYVSEHEFKLFWMFLRIFSNQPFPTHGFLVWGFYKYKYPVFCITILKRMMQSPSL